MPTLPQTSTFGIKLRTFFDIFKYGIVKRLDMPVELLNVPKIMSFSNEEIKKSDF